MRPLPIDRAWLTAHPLPWPDGDTDKNKRGRVLAAGGSRKVPAALALTGEAAFRAGAGKVQLAGPEPAALALGVAMPEAAVFGLAVNADGELAAAAGARIADLLGRCDALALGPGMGAEAEAAPILDAVLAAPGEHIALLLDAAMLAAVPDCDDRLRAWKGARILTPHPGEMAALMGCDADEVSPDLAQRAAERFDAVVALKSSETWIAAPGEAMLHYPGGGPGLATGGSGDVLAGIVAGLLARGASPRIATAWGVWLHGEAGKRLADRIGPLGFLGRELAAEIPALMAEAQP